MVAPKGEPKVSQSYVYKGSESKLVDSAKAEEMKADGWFDNPADAKSPPKPAAKKAAKDK